MKTCGSCQYFFTKDAKPSCYHPLSSAGGDIVGISCESMLEHFCQDHKRFEPIPDNRRDRKLLIQGRIVTGATLIEWQAEEVKRRAERIAEDEQKAEQALIEFLLNIPIDFDGALAKERPYTRKARDLWLEAYLLDLPEEIILPAS